MYESMFQEMARQHIRELEEEAATARLAKIARGSKATKPIHPTAAQADPRAGTVVGVTTRTRAESFPQARSRPRAARCLRTCQSIPQVSSVAPQSSIASPAYSDAWRPSRPRPP